MDFKTLFKEELAKPETEYFILDSKGGDIHGDVDFHQYNWDRTKNNKVKKGDLFLYRRPQNSSETRKFYFFGAGKIESVVGEMLVCGRIEKPYPFQNELHQDELEGYQWHWKKRGHNWANFFNEYGMNHINKDDFERLLQLSEGKEGDEYAPDAAKEAANDIQRGNYFVEDTISTVKRRSKQSVFSNKVKSNYKNKCAICGINTRKFLVGSHIIPWSVRKDIRLDPSNGISLCVLHDKAFDQGYITIDSEMRVSLSYVVKADKILDVELKKFSGKRIKLPSESPPKEEYLRYHRDEIYQKEIVAD